MTHDKIKAAVFKMLVLFDEHCEAYDIEKFSEESYGDEAMKELDEALALLGSLPQPTPQEIIDDYNRRNTDLTAYSKQMHKEAICGEDTLETILREAHNQLTKSQNAEADNIRPSVQAAVDKISQSNSGSDYKSEIIGDLTILHRDDPHSNAEVLEGQPLENEGDFATPLDCLDALLNIALYGNHAKDLKECAYREIATIRAALKAAPKNWLEAQLEEARKDYENWPDWKKKCSRTGEFIRNRNSSKDGGE